MKPLLLFQRTPFCMFIRDRLKSNDRFRNRFWSMDTVISTFSEGKKEFSGFPRAHPTVLVWGDGTNHHFSNLLNLPGSIKRVWDAHTDMEATDVDSPLTFENHNSHSVREGVLLRVSPVVDIRGDPIYSVFDERPGNGLLHISVDLDVVNDFPSLGWMSRGNLTIAQLLEQVRIASTRSQRLVRFDVGGFSEDPGVKDWIVYQKYYRPLLEEVVQIF